MDAGQRTHELRTWLGFFDAIADGRRRFEVRRNDRHYLEGDRLVLREFDPAVAPPGSRNVRDPRYTGREVRATVTYVLPGGRFGIDPEYAVLGIDVD